MSNPRNRNRRRRDNAPKDIVVGGLHAVRTSLARASEDALELWLKNGIDKTLDAEFSGNAERLGVSRQYCDLATLDRLNGDSHHQGVVLRRRSPSVLGIDELSQHLTSLTTPLVLVLDAIQDPRNFGACLRVADGAGVVAVVYPKDKSAAITSVVAKAASGAIDTVALVPVTNLASAMRTLKDSGLWLVGLAHDAPKTLYRCDLAVGSAVVLGNEGSGMRRLTRDLCDEVAAIPLHGQVSSLNVSTAAAVCLFEACRQRDNG